MDRQSSRKRSLIDELLKFVDNYHKRRKLKETHDKAKEEIDKILEEGTRQSRIQRGKIK